MKERDRSASEMLREMVLSVGNLWICFFSCEMLCEILLSETSALPSGMLHEFLALTPLQAVAFWF